MIAPHVCPLHGSRIASSAPVRSTNSKWRLRALERHARSGGARPSGNDVHMALRVRAGVPGLFGERGTARQIEQALSTLEGVRVVRANPYSGTVLCTFDRSAHADARSTVISTLRLFAEPNALPPPSWSHFVGTLARAGESLGSLRDAIGRSLPRRASESNGDRGNGMAVPAWHALPLEEVARKFGSDLSRGLTASEADRIADRKSVV